jgi:hypothetical protein
VLEGETMVLKRSRVAKSFRSAICISVAVLASCRTYRPDHASTSQIGGAGSTPITSAAKTTARGEHDLIEPGIAVLTPRRVQQIPADIRGKFDSGAEIELTAADPQMVEEAIAILRGSLAKLPTPFVCSNLKNIVLVESVRVDGVPYGGTNWPETQTVYVTLPSAGHGGRGWDWAVEQTFLAEFASIVLIKYWQCFPHAEWGECNEPGFKYGEGGRAAIMFGYPNCWTDSTLIERGFIADYSMSGVREDFDTLFAAMLTAEPGMWRRCLDSRCLSRKIALAMDFLHFVDRSLDREWLDALHVATWSAFDDPHDRSPSMRGGGGSFIILPKPQ